MTPRAPRGETMFARFAFPPNDLGLCGPDDSEALFGYASSGTVDGGVRELSRGFDGAWPYLQLIAGCNGIDDPLDRRVVQAYWIGNELSTRVPTDQLAREVEARFRSRAGGDLGCIHTALDARLAPTHGFHVFAVYPWVGLLRSGRTQPAVHVLDSCRIRWGQVLELDDDHAVVAASHLFGGPLGLHLGPPRAESLTVGRRGDHLAGELQTGDWVAVHWDWVCGRLDQREVATLEHHTGRCLSVVNDLLRDPGEHPQAWERLAASLL